MEILKEVTEMCCVKNSETHGPAVIPQEGHWDKVTKIEQSMVSHMVVEHVHLNKVLANFL